VNSARIDPTDIRAQVPTRGANVEVAPHHARSMQDVSTHQLADPSRVDSYRA